MTPHVPPQMHASRLSPGILINILVLVGQYSVWHIRVLEGQLQ